MGSLSGQSYFQSDTDSCRLTRHAQARMAGRAISTEAIDLVITYGRVARVRGAVIYAVGHKEVVQDTFLLKQCEGIHVVCSPENGAVITTYRNRSLRGLRH